MAQHPAVRGVGLQGGVAGEEDPEPGQERGVVRIGVGGHADRPDAYLL
jgi:hypothetical protein